MRDSMMRADTIRHMPRQYNVLAPRAERRRSLTYPDTRRYHNDTSAHEAVKFNVQGNRAATGDLGIQKSRLPPLRLTALFGDCSVAVQFGLELSLCWGLLSAWLPSGFCTGRNPLGLTRSCPFAPKSMISSAALSVTISPSVSVIWSFNGGAAVLRSPVSFWPAFVTLATAPITVAVLAEISAWRRETGNCSFM